MRGRVRRALCGNGFRGSHCLFAAGVLVAVVSAALLPLVKRRHAPQLDEADIAKALSVSARMVRGYLSDVKADLRKQQREKVFSLWLQCWTQEQIAEAVGLDQSEVSREIGEVCQLEAVPNNIKLAALHQDADWQPPLFDVWTAARNNNAVKHYGNTAACPVLRV